MRLKKKLMKTMATTRNKNDQKKYVKFTDLENWDDHIANCVHCAKLISISLQPVELRHSQRFDSFFISLV